MMEKRVLISVVLIVAITDCILAQEEKPIVKVIKARFDYRKDDHLKVPEDVGTLLGKNNTIQLKRAMSHIFIECIATGPVQWHFDGVTAPLQLNMTAFRRFQNGKEIFVAEFFILRTTSQITGKWSCRSINNPKVETVIHIFGDEQGYRGEDAFFLEYGKSLTVTGKLGDEVIFPCVSWKRNIKAYLARKVHAGIGTVYKDVDPSVAIYDSTVGFRVKLTEPTPWGSYLCYTNLNKTFDVLKITLKEEYNVIVTPANGSLELFENTAMTLTCGTDNPRLTLSISYKPNGVVDPRVDYFANETFARFVYNNLTFSDDGMAKCVAVDSEGREVFEHLWSYSVINEQDKKRRGWRYYFSQRTQKDSWACWTGSSKVPSVAFVACTSPMECEVKSSCFHSDNRCDEIDARGCAGGCVLISIVRTPGIIVCRGDGLPSTRVNLYIGTSNATYNNTQRLEADILTAFSDNANETYVGAIIEINCTGSSFYFARGFYWSVRTWFGNESENYNRLDNDTRALADIAEVIEHEEKFLPTGLIFLRSKIKLLSTDIKEIVCYAPHWNSFDKSPYVLPYTVKETTLPHFLVEDMEEINLSLGAMNETITCNVEGIPPPTVSWMKDGLHIPRTILVVDDGKSLFFEEVAYAQQGKYTCRATNAGGSVTKHYTVYVTDPKYKVIIGVSVAGVIGMIILLGILALFWRRIQRQKVLLRDLTDKEIEEFLYGNPDAINRTEDTNRQGHLLAYNREYEFPKDFLDIQMEEKLGSGAYGLVLKGIARGLFPGEEETIVAVKTLQPNADISYFKSILIELKIMSVIGRHAHIVNLLGACTTDIRKREVFIIVEFCANGSLEKFLKSHRSDFSGSCARYSVEPKRATVLYENAPEDAPLKITILNLVQFCYEIAKGMEYLSSKKIIHGDMAARNVLVTDKLITKIGDFGLSRQLYEYTNYVKKQQAPLPWRWMAIESLCDMEFSCKSDVWAYGVTLWEIFSLGEVPYPGMTWTDDFVRKLRQGNRPPQPEQAWPSIYNVMVECWRYEPNDRPSFSELATIFINILSQQGVTVQEPPSPPMRKKFELQVNNGTYGINKQVL